MKTTLSSDLPPSSSVILLDLLFDPEDEDDVFLRNVCLFPNDVT
jgi:hypothetical protein